LAKPSKPGSQPIKLTSPNEELTYTMWLQSQKTERRARAFETASGSRPAQDVMITQALAAVSAIQALVQHHKQGISCIGILATARQHCECEQGMGSV